MKKKLFAALAAGAMLCGMLTAPVSAAETKYQTGDVNMNGAVDIEDAQLALQFWCTSIAYKQGDLTEEQQALGNVDGEVTTIKWEKGQIDTPISMRDAQILLIYYTRRMTNQDLTIDDVLVSLNLK